MNYTFLPSAEQNDVKREYQIRTAIVFLFFLSVSLIIGIGSLFPSYINALLQERLHLSDVNALQKTADASALAATEGSLSASTALMSALASSVSPGPFSGAIAAIAAVRGNVVIDSFTLGLPSPSSLSVTLSGLAPTRAALLAFQTRLEGIAPGVSVDLPVSELARDTNIPFSIRVTEPMP